MTSAFASAKGGLGVLNFGDHSCTAVEEFLAHVDEKGRQHGLLARKVPVNGRATDASGGAEIFHGHSIKAALGEETGRSIEQSPAAIGLGACPWSLSRINGC